MGLRPLTAILDQRGVPIEVSTPPAGDRAIAHYTGTNLETTSPTGHVVDPHTQVTNPAGDQITVPDINLTKPSSDNITIPDTKLDKLSSNNITVPDITLNKPNADNITVPNVKLDTPAGDKITIPNTTLSSADKNKITIPDTNIKVPASNLISIPDTNLGKISQEQINIPNVKLDSPSGDNIINPDVKVSTPIGDAIQIPKVELEKPTGDLIANPNITVQQSKADLITIPNTILADPALDLITDPGTLLSSPLGDVTTIPNISLGSPLADVTTIPDITLDGAVAGDGTIIPNIVLGQPSLDLIAIPDIMLDSAVAGDGTTIPNISLGAVNQNVTTIPNIGLATPNANVITIPTIQLDGAVPGDGITIPNITRIIPPADVTTIPEIVLGRLNVNPQNMGDVDIMKKAYDGGYQPMYSLMPVGNNSVYPDVLKQPSGFMFRPEFTNKASDASLFTKDKIGGELENVYKNKKGSFTSLNGTPFNIFWPDFGHDRPDDGSSKAPYVTRRIGQTWAPFSAGFLTSLNRGLWDVVRLGRWAIDGANGIMFLLKQTGLQLSNPKLETSLGQRPFLPIMPTRIYNPIKLPLQMLGLPLGLHMPRHGILPEPPLNYERVNALNNMTGLLETWNDTSLGGNRLLKYYSDTVQFSSIFLKGADGFLGGYSSSPYKLVKGTIEKLTKRIREAKPIGITVQLKKEYKEVKNFFGDGGMIISEMSGLAGPKSVFGIGWTDHWSYKRKFEIGWTDKDGAPQDISFNYRPVDGGRYVEALAKADNFSMIYLTIKDMLKDNVVGSGVPFKLGGIGGDGVMHPEVSMDANINYFPAEGSTYQDVLNDLPEDPFKSNLIGKIGTEFGPTGINGEGLSIDGVTGVTDGLIIPGASNLYQKLVGLSNGDVNGAAEHSSPGFNAHNFDSLWTDDNLVRGYQSSDVGVRNSYPTESKAGYGTMRRLTDANSNEGANGQWPDMYARVGVQNTGIGQFDKLMANIKPDADISQKGRDFVRVMFKRRGGQNVSFRAYLSGLTDKWNPDWNSVNYVGRPDKISVYTGVNRDINFSLMIVAESHKIIKQVYARLNTLATYTMPEYTTAGVMKGPIVILTIGSLMRNLPGYISSLDFDFSDEYPWDIEIEKPMYVKANISFTVIGQAMPNATLNWYPESSLANSAFNSISGEKDTPPADPPSAD